MRSKRIVQAKRLNIELSESAYKRLKALETASGAASATEVLRRALAVYDVLVAAARSGERVILKRGEVEREVLLIE